MKPLQILRGLTLATGLMTAGQAAAKPPEPVEAAVGLRFAGQLGEEAPKNNLDTDLSASLNARVLDNLRAGFALQVGQLETDRDADLINADLTFGNPSNPNATTLTAGFIQPATRRFNDTPPHELEKYPSPMGGLISPEGLGAPGVRLNQTIDEHAQASFTATQNSVGAGGTVQTDKASLTVAASVDRGETDTIGDNLVGEVNASAADNDFFIGLRFTGEAENEKIAYDAQFGYDSPLGAPFVTMRHQQLNDGGKKTRDTTIGVGYQSPVFPLGCQFAVMASDTTHGITANNGPFGELTSTEAILTTTVKCGTE